MTLNNSNQAKKNSLQDRNRSFALICGGLVVVMIGAAYAAVPLYTLFCRVTGFGGTTQQATVAPSVVLDRTMGVRFDSTVSKGLPWHFKPVQREIVVKVGESTLAFYQAKNESDKTWVGTASFNVTPDRAGQYFTKIECFCFTEQVLEPGQVVDMPVTFYIDPEIVKDRSFDSVQTITLSYTFFPLEDQDQLAALGANE
jgi:cytochrome c oxidase assembly protein subunit 11